jgi:CheY-like chemotaxis protein
VVIDLMMPGMDGFEFIDRFRQSPQSRGAPIIVWTVKDLTLAERSRLRGAAHAVVSKSARGAAGLVEELRSLWAAPPEVGN